VPVAVIALTVAAGAIAVRRSLLIGQSRLAAFWLALSLPATLLLLAYALGVRVSAGTSRLYFDGSTGFDPLFTLVIGTAFAVVAAAFGWALAPPVWTAIGKID
jgi:hypothetical protein